MHVTKGVGGGEQPLRDKSWQTRCIAEGKKKKERNTVNPTGVEGKRKKKDNRRLSICPPVAGDYFGASGVGMRQFLLLVPGKQKAESDLGGRRGAAGADQT